MNSEAWQTLPILKANYVRLLDPDGDVEDIDRGHLEGTLECSDEPLRTFYSQKQWLAFVDEQKGIANNWNSRFTFTKEDAAMLAEMGIGWDVRSQLDQEWTTGLIWQWEFQAVVKEHGTAAEKKRLKKMLKESAKGTAKRFSKKGEFMKLARSIAAGAEDAPGETPAEAIRRRAEEYARVLRAVTFRKDN